MPATRASDVPINMEATCSPVDPDEWAVSFAMCHTPKRIYVDNLTEVGFGNEGTHVYVEEKTCKIRLMPMSGYHCMACGELVTLYDANDMLRRVSYCPCCGRRVLR